MLRFYGSLLETSTLFESLLQGSETEKREDAWKGFTELEGWDLRVGSRVEGGMMKVLWERVSCEMGEVVEHGSHG